MGQKKKQNKYPSKRNMNLYYKPDRTTVPATIALYVLFALAVLLGLSKVLIYDLWMEEREIRGNARRLEQEMEGYQEELLDYDLVQEKYNRYSATEEEDAQVDRMEVLSLLNEAVQSRAEVMEISISGTTALIRFSGVTLRETAEIVMKIEESPLVLKTNVDTAATTEDGMDLVTANILIELQKEGAIE